MGQNSSKEWYKKHINDPFVKRANAEKQRARSIYKLEEIQKKFQIIQSRHHVLDIGCAPGSWMQFAKKKVGPKGKVVGIDLLSIKDIEGVVALQGSFSDKDVQELALEELNQKIDVVLSDLSPNISGHSSSDQYKAQALWEEVLEFCRQSLNTDGVMVIKVFHGVAFEPFYKNVKSTFKSVKTLKPAASRQESKEVYIIASKKR